MAVFGIWQKDAGGEVRHVVAKRLVDLTALLGNLNTVSRDFH
jgi:error-prone DNA polymerase